MLRILDCFLLEGPKVMFRLALGVLKLNARHLLSITDPVGLFQTLKEIAKHSFDIDHLFKVQYGLITVQAVRLRKLHAWMHVYLPLSHLR